MTLATIAAILGALALAAGLVTAIVGGVFVVFVPQLLIGGILLLVGLAIERWRYKPIVDKPPEPEWLDTGERFVDPETRLLTAVYFNPLTGERQYVSINR